MPTSTSITNADQTPLKMTRTSATTTPPSPPSANPTPPRTQTLYFAYGSNLSPTQMSRRCPSTAPPIAIAKLSSYTWFICQRGYANILSVPTRPRATYTDTHATTIWGLLYDLHANDEVLLDGYEGWSEEECGGANPRVKDRVWRPWEQGRCDYNKLYLKVEVTRWLADPHSPTLSASTIPFIAGKPNVVRALVYVDEIRTSLGRINDEYVFRLSRAALQSIPLGVPEKWIDAVMGMHGVKWWKGIEEGGKDGTLRVGLSSGFNAGDEDEKGDGEEGRKV